MGLAKALALEWAPRRITVNAVCPGWVDTVMARADIGRAAERQGVPPTQARAAAEAGIPLGRFVTPDEVAGLVEWLASAEAGMITGQAYGISGGEVIG
jgi:NAD(P)-dependent dehydrogenase (short-subunit alcohol dehydrogenase family)